MGRWPRADRPGAGGVHATDAALLDQLARPRRAADRDRGKPGRQPPDRRGGRHRRPDLLAQSAARCLIVTIARATLTPTMTHGAAVVSKSSGTMSAESAATTAAP